MVSRASSDEPVSGLMRRARPESVSLDVFEHASVALWIAFQPIVCASDASIFGHEALVRSDHPALGSPAELFRAASRLRQLRALSRRIRELVAAQADSAPAGSLLFVNLHATELEDPSLYDASAPLSRFASRVVLEITESTSVHRVVNLRARVSRLRALGFRVALDDFGAGYSGLSSLTAFEPDLVKLDGSLVRNIERSGAKASVVRSLIDVCTRELGMRVVCEGVETEPERAKLKELGAGLLQGFLLARPARGFSASLADAQSDSAALSRSHTVSSTRIRA